MYDLKDVKIAARGHWTAIMERVAGISDEFLDDRHGPCPRCGGNDRWRVFSDFAETGGCICQQCGQFGDGIAALQCFLSIGFPEAIKRVGDFLGVAPARKQTARPTRKHGDPLRHVQWQPWSDANALLWCRGKPSITADGLKTMNARMATYRKQYSVVAIPITDLEGKQIGYSLYPFPNQRLPHFTKAGVEWLKVKTIKT